MNGKDTTEILLRIDDVRKIIPVSKTTWYELIKKYEELKPLKLGRSSFWKKSTILKFIEKM